MRINLNKIYKNWACERTNRNVWLSWELDMRAWDETIQYGATLSRVVSKNKNGLDLLSLLMLDLGSEILSGSCSELTSQVHPIIIFL